MYHINVPYQCAYTLYLPHLNVSIDILHTISDTISITILTGRENCSFLHILTSSSQNDSDYTRETFLNIVTVTLIPGEDLVVFSWYPPSTPPSTELHVSCDWLPWMTPADASNIITSSNQTVPKFLLSSSKPPDFRFPLPFLFLGLTITHKNHTIWILH